jgi:hypothetical protein
VLQRCPFFERANGCRFGLHIEVKRLGEALRGGQAESYPYIQYMMDYSRNRMRKENGSTDFNWAIW